jgi:hypothetical protein
LLRLAYVLAGNQHAGEDLLQTALTKAAAHWGRIRGAPEGYVRRIMYREQVSWWRRRARRPEIAMADVPELPARDEVAGVEARLALRDALLALPPGKRVMLGAAVPGGPARGAGGRHLGLFCRHRAQPDAQGDRPVEVGAAVRGPGE